DRPQHVLDVRQRHLMRTAERGDGLFGHLSCEPNRRKQERPGNEGFPRGRHGMLETTPALIRATATAAAITAHQSSDTRTEPPRLSQNSTTVHSRQPIATGSTNSGKLS